MELIWFTLLVSLVIQLALFIPAFKFKTDKLTDLSYSMTFAILAAILYSKSTGNILHLILLLMIFLWAFRLGIYLFIRINKIGKDARFDGMRENFFTFLRFWVLQGLVVWVVMLSSIQFFARDVSEFGLFSLVGLSLFIVGLLMETMADHQKFVFKNNKNNKGKFIRTGVWEFSRHPNYFGEFSLWVGVFVYSMQGFVNSSWYGILSPIFIFVVLYYVSGIPMLEKSYEKRFGKDWEDYKKKTNKFFPFFKKIVVK